MRQLRNVTAEVLKPLEQVADGLGLVTAIAVIAAEAVVLGAGLPVQLLNGLTAPRRGRPPQQRPISSYDRQTSPHNLAPSFMPRGRVRPMANY